MPKISVIMPAYNAEKYIGEAIESILNQSFRDFEFIILNDCSSDATESIILSYDDERIVYVKNEENLGVARTLNKGLALARGEYIARMDADDISMPERFELQVQYLEEHLDVAVLGTAVELFFEEQPPQRRTFSADPRQMHIDLLFGCGFAHPSVMMRAGVIQEMGGYDPEFEGLEDYELWWRVSQYRQVCALGQVLLRYRVHESQVTKNPSPQHLARQRRLKEKQLERLGLPAGDRYAQSYYDYCLGNRPGTLAGVETLCVFLESVIYANAKVRLYDQKLLEANLRGIAQNAAAGLKLSEAARACVKSKLVRPGGLAERKLRRLLGR